MFTANIKGAAKKGGKLLSKTLEKANQLLEVKAALEQLSIETSVQSSVSTYSSMSECDSDGESGVMDQDQDRVDRLGRKEREASHETLSTTVTSADEFVWIDSHNRCVVCRTIIIEIIDKYLLLQTCRGSTPALVH